MPADGLGASVRLDHQLLAVEREHRVHCLLELTAPPKGSGARVPAREGITHMAAIARLVLGYGHPADTVRSESPKFEVDIVVFDLSAREAAANEILGVEVKVEKREHEALSAGMQACRGNGGDEAHRSVVLDRFGRRLPEAQARNHHKKCRWVAEHRPSTFWIVSRDQSDVFEVRSPSDADFELMPLPDEALSRENVERRSVMGGSRGTAGKDRIASNGPKT